MSLPTIFVENVYEILKILDKVTCLVKFRSMTKRFTSQTARKAISKGLGRRIKIAMVKDSFL